MTCSLFDIRKITNRVKITRRFYWCIGHCILIRLAIFSWISNNRTIDSDFICLFFVTMGKTQIHSCFHIIFDMPIKLLLPLDFAWMHQTGIVLWALYHVKSYVFFWFPAILFLENASHASMLRMDAVSYNGCRDLLEHLFCSMANMPVDSVWSH